MSMYNQFKTDEKIERKGVWVEYEGFRVKIARAGGSNRKYNALAEQLSKPIRRAMETDTLSDERALKVMHELYAQAVILEWEVGSDEKGWKPGIEMEDGSIGDVTVENVKTTFKNLPDLFTDLKSLAEKMTLFKAKVQEEEAGN